MSSPIDLSRVATNSLTGTTFAVNVGSPDPFKLLIVMVRWAGAPGTLGFTGYTSLNGASGDASDASDDSTLIVYRWTDGTEGATDNFTATNSVKGCALAWQIEGAANPAQFAPEISTVAVGTTAINTANPGSRAVTGGPKDVLYLALCAMDGEANSPTVAPTNYTNLTTANSGTAGLPATNCTMAGGSRAILNSNSDDPGVFTHAAAAAGWTAYTVAIRPPLDMPIVTVGPPLGY